MARRQLKKENGRRMQAVVILAVACVIFALTGSYFALKNYVEKVDKDRICENVYIGKIDVSGMDAEEARSELENHLASDRGIKVELKLEETSAEAVLGELGVYIEDVDGLIQKAMNYGKEGSIWQRYRELKKLKKEAFVVEKKFAIDAAAATAIFEERVIPIQNVAQNATITRSDAGFVIEPEREGTTVNVEESLTKIADYLNEGWGHQDFSIDLVMQKDEPEITAEDLGTITDELGSFSTYAGGGDRWQNLKTGVDRLNGIVMMPGDELSVYYATAPYDAEHGYVEAGAYENGQVVPAYGGGICQVSTTLYNAVIYAELEIVERAPHSMTVDYVEPSRDAAIAGDYLDFRFKNPYDTPIYIYGEIDGENQLRFIIYGQETRPESRTIEFESETLSTEEYGVVYEENPELPFGEMESTGNPHVGKSAQLWKIVYENGQEVSREVFNTSHYMKSDEIIEVGTSGGSAAAVSLLQTAIASQDKAQIQNAINEGIKLSSPAQENTEEQSAGEEGSS